MKKETIEREKTCENCRHFSQYYVKSNASYCAIHLGHCSNSDLNEKEKKKRLYKLACEFWEPVAIRNAERREVIKETLTKMARRIEAMALILEDEGDI